MWHVYILQTQSGPLYTGITNDLVRRMKEHQEGKGSHFTRAFKFSKLLYQRACRTRSTALKREAAIKNLTREEKLKLISTYHNKESVL